MNMEKQLYLVHCITAVVMTLRHCDENFEAGKHRDYSLGEAPNRELVRIYTNDEEDYLTAQYKGVDVGVHRDGTSTVTLNHEVNPVDFNIIGWAEGLLDLVICTTPTSRNAEVG
jgi:hypothetical protein